LSEPALSAGSLRFTVNVASARCSTNVRLHADRMILANDEPGKQFRTHD
jgi:hypothetical protein